MFKSLFKCCILILYSAVVMAQGPTWKTEAFHDSSTGVPSDHIQTWLADSDNRLWFGTTTDSFGYVHQGKWAYFNLFESPSMTLRIMALAQTTDGRIWLGCAKGLWYFEHDTWQQVPRFAQSTIYALAPDAQGGIYLSNENDIYHFLNGNCQALLTGHAFVEQMLVAPDGTLWYTLHEQAGIANLKGTQKKRYDKSGGHLPSNLVYGICADTLGGIWVATNKGLTYLIDGKATIYSRDTHYPLDDVQVAGICQDKNGAIWCNTGSGSLYKSTQHADFQRVESAPLKGKAVQNLKPYGAGVAMTQYGRWLWIE